MALPQISQDDFSAGSVLSVARHLIPRTGAYRIVDGLLDDDASVYRRGGSTYKSNAVFSSTALRALWDGFLPAVGARTLFATPAAFGVLAADDVTPTSIGGGGLTEPVPMAQLGDFLWIGGGKLYAGSRVTGPYSTGTVTATSGSTTVTGSSTSWDAGTDIDAGSIISFSGDATRFYVVASVDSTTQITLTEPFLGTTGAGQTYSSVAIATVSGRGGRSASIYGQAGGRLLTFENEKAYFSNGVDATTGRLCPQVFSANDYWKIPGGGRGIAVATVRDRALLFSTAGLYMLSNLALDLTDPSGNIQQRLEQVSPDLIAWGAAGITNYQNAVIAACTDGVYLVDGVSAPVLLSGAISPRYSAYVRAGHKPGQIAVYRSHLIVPVLNGSNVWVDTMVCHLDRPTNTSAGKIWPWVFLTGHAANVTAVATRVAHGSQRSPALLGAGTDRRVLDLSGMFEPAAAVKNDADGTTHALIVETRDYRTSLSGALNRNLARKLRARYELVDAASDNPTIRAYVSTGRATATTQSLWGTMVWGTDAWGDSSLDLFEPLGGLAPEADIRAPWTWVVNRKSEFVRFRLETVGAAASCSLRSIDVAVRQSRKDY